MPVDTSSYNTTPVNPLASAGQAVGIQNALNQNRLFDQTFAARKAVGQAYQGAIDPTTGQLNTNKLLSGVANNPNAAFMAGDVTAQALQNQQGQTNLQKSQLDLAMQHYANMAGAFGGLARNPNLSKQDFVNTGNDLVKQGMITQDTLDAEKAQIPDSADPGTYQGIARNLLTRTLDGAGKINAMYGSPQVINNGSSQQVVAASPLMGTTSPISPVIPNQLSPGENAARIPTFIGGQLGSAPQSSLVDPTGHALTPTAAQPSALGTGRYPTPNALAAPQAAPATPAAITPSAPAGFVPSGPVQGSEARANATATGNVTQELNLQQAASTVPTQKAALSNMLDDLQKFQSGATSGAKYDVKNFLQSNTPAIASAFGIKPENIAAQESFGKLANQIQLAQESQLAGAGTDLSRSVIHGANPNADLSQEGNVNMIHMLQGNADALAAIKNQWQSIKTANPNADYGDFVANNAQNFDPRVFQAQYLAPQDRQKLITSLTSQEKPAFVKTLRMARDNGYIPNLPGAPNAGQ